MCHFDAEQVFVQSKQGGVMFVRRPPGCCVLSAGKVVTSDGVFHGVRQASRTRTRTWHHKSTRGMKCRFGFESCAAGACVVRLID